MSVPTTTHIDSFFEAEILQGIASAAESADLSRAADLATRALNRGMRHPVLFNVRALRLEQKGRHEDALMEYRAASLLAPSDPLIYNAVGLCLISLNKPEDAVQAFEQAIAHRPSLAVSHHRRGFALSLLQDTARARISFESALELDPFHFDSMTALSALLCKSSEIPKARYFAESALLLQPRAPVALITMAIVELAEKSYKAAEQTLGPLLSGPDTAFKARAHGLLGDALHAQGFFAEAFDAYTKGNDLLQKVHLLQPNAISQTTRQARRVTSFVRNTNSTRWSQPASLQSDNDAENHVFIVGFMRSGTTLLEHVLSAHPDIRALDERDILASLGIKYLATDAGLSALLDLSGEEMEKARAFYWDSVRKIAGSVAGKNFIDKLPFNALKLPLIAKLFPSAKVILAIRDPRDVVLSCFRRHLEMNVTPPEFLSLAETAELYSETMALIETCQEKLPLSFFNYRHENLVENFDDQLSVVSNFVGIAQVENMKNFVTHTPPVALRSPSAPQIRRGLNDEGVGQWRDYAEQLAPVMPVLAPWIEKFGYPNS